MSSVAPLLLWSHYEDVVLVMGAWKSVGGMVVLVLRCYTVVVGGFKWGRWSERGNGLYESCVEE